MRTTAWSWESTCAVARARGRSKVLASRLANTYEVRALTDLRGPWAAYPYVFELDARGVSALVSETITLVSETVADGGRSWCLQG
jgi:hypothetical protein